MAVALLCGRELTFQRWLELVPQLVSVGCQIWDQLSYSHKNFQTHPRVMTASASTHSRCCNLAAALFSDVWDFFWSNWSLIPPKLSNSRLVPGNIQTDLEKHGKEGGASPSAQKIDIKPRKNGQQQGDKPDVITPQAGQQNCKVDRTDVTSLICIFGIGFGLDVKRLVFAG